MTLVGGEQVLRVYYEHTFDNNSWEKKPGNLLFPEGGQERVDLFGDTDRGQLDRL